MKALIDKWQRRIETQRLASRDDSTEPREAAWDRGFIAAVVECKYDLEVLAASGAPPPQGERK